MSFCKKCGTEVNSNAKFCKNCGLEIKKEAAQTGDNYRSTNDVRNYNEEVYAADNFSPDYNGENQHLTGHMDAYPAEVRTAFEKRPSKKGSGLKILIIILSVILAALIAVAVWILVDDADVTSEEKNGNDAEKEEQSETAEDEKSEDDEEKSKTKFDRNSTYYPELVYENMEEIYSSEGATDRECFELEEFITKYNSSWIDYINNGDQTIYGYLREGSYAYDTAQKYQTPTFSEEMHYMKVNDVRKTDNTYFVWCHEKIGKYWFSGENEEKEYRWVYEIGKDSEGFYVERYTTDPYYEK